MALWDDYARIHSALTLIALFILGASDIHSETVVFEHAGSVGGMAADIVTCAAKDLSGNVYLAGYFYETTDLDPGPGIAQFTTIGGYDIFILKLDPYGDFVWAKSIGGVYGDFPEGIVTDQEGSLLVTGAYSHVVDFDPGPGTFLLGNPNLDSGDIFLLKLSSSGDFLWAESFGGPTGDHARAIGLDASENILVAGTFTSTADFDPSPDTANLTSPNNDTIFILKLNPEGNYIWARAAGGASANGDYVHDARVGPNGEICVTGYFGGQGDFDPGQGEYYMTPAGNIDMFLLMLDQNGDFLWARGISGADVETGHSVAVAPSGDVYATGYFSGTADFDPGPSTRYITANDVGALSTAFVLKLDSIGNYLWANKIEGTGSAIGEAIAIDASGSEYVTGRFWGDGDFDPGSGTVKLTSLEPDTSDVFALKLDADGDFIWATSFGGMKNDWGNAILPEENANVFVAGCFDSDVDFNPGAGIAALTSMGSWDVFGVSLWQAPVAVTDIVLLDDSPSNNDDVLFLVNFDASVSGVGLDDFNLSTTGEISGSSLSSVAGLDSVYVVKAKTGIGDGTLRLDLLDNDSIATTDSSLPLGGLGEHNGDFLDGEHYVIDKTPPNIAFSSNAPYFVNQPFYVYAKISEPNTDFSFEHISTTNAIWSEFSGVGTDFGFVVNPVDQGTFSVRVGGGAFFDLADNHNTASNVLEGVYDTISPTVLLASDTSSTVSNEIVITASLSEDNISFRKSHLTPTNASVRSFAGEGREYVFFLTPLTEGQFSVVSTSGSFSDAAGNISLDSNRIDRWFVAARTTVITPNGGEEWAQGSVREITWISSGGEASHVSIELYRDSTLVKTIDSAAPNTGHYQWVISVDEPLGTNYRIRVTPTTKPSFGDSSDSTFSTIEASGGSCPAAKVFSDNPSSLKALRDFRDGYLSKTALGNIAIRSYYTIAPTISGAVENSSAAAFMFRTLAMPFVAVGSRM